MTHAAYASELHQVVRSYKHPCPGNSVAIGLAVTYKNMLGLPAHSVQE